MYVLVCVSEAGVGVAGIAQISEFSFVIGNITRGPGLVSG